MRDQEGQRNKYGTAESYSMLGLVSRYQLRVRKELAKFPLKIPYECTTLETTYAIPLGSITITTVNIDYVLPMC